MKEYYSLLLKFVKNYENFLNIFYSCDCLWNCSNRNKQKLKGYKFPRFAKNIIFFIKNIA